MSPIELVAAVIAVFFAVGIVVGIMLVAAMSRDSRPQGLNGGPPHRFGDFQPGPRDQPDTGPSAEPDDRDDQRWWANGR